MIAFNEYGSRLNGKQTQLSFVSTTLRCYRLLIIPVSVLKAEISSPEVAVHAVRLRIQEGKAISEPQTDSLVPENFSP